MCRNIGFSVFLVLCGIQMVFAQNHKSVITVIDSLNVDMTNMNQTICIDEKVVLSCVDKNIFAYEWIDLSTGNILSTASSVTVSPDSTHQYRLNLYYFTGELIKNGDFEDVSLPENKRVITDYQYGSRRNEYGFLGPEGTYRIGKNPRDFHVSFYRISDHTSGRGNMMVVNGSKSGNAIVWKQTVAVKKGNIYAFSTWGIEVGRNNPAEFHFTINGRTLGRDFQLRDDGESDARWEQFYELWEADANTAVISLVNLNTQTDGNDFAIDDISFASMKKETGIITVQVLPAVKLGKLDDMEKCEEEKISVNAQATGTGISGYTWTKDGHVLSFSGSLLEFASVKSDDSGVYTCSVTGECGIRKESFRIDVREKLRTGKIRDTVRPCEKERVTFEADVRGYSPVYRWTKPLKSQGWMGEKTDTYINNEIYWYRDTGTYACRVTSMCGDTTVYRTLESGTKIKIVSWPGDQYVCAGSDLKLIVGTNIEPFNVTWQGPGISGLVYGKELILRGLNEKNVGVYHCVVYDRCKESEERTLILKVAPVMTMLEVSKDTAVCENGKAVFRAKADGVKTKYEWTGPENFSAGTAEIVIDPVTPGRIGTYRVTATDSCGTRKTGEMNLSFLKEYDDLQITGDIEVCPGEIIQIEVTGGKKNMTYSWTHPGGKHSTGTVVRTKAEEGKYVCQVSGVCLPVEKSMTVALQKTLQAQAGENNFRVCPGETVHFSAVATGSEIVCEWWKDAGKVGEELSLRLNDVQPVDAGEYLCRIYSACGDTVLHYTLQLKELLKITDHTVEKFVKRGEKTSLFVNVSGDGQRRYEWLEDGRVIPGTVGNRLEIEAPDREVVVVYTCRVAGCNTVEITIPVSVRDFQTLERDTAVLLCKGEDYAYRVPEKPDGWCPTGTTRTYWVYNGKDTVGRGNAITFAGFQNEMVGEYVYTLDSDCGKEIVRLRVDSMKVPEITAIYTDSGIEKNGFTIACQGTDIQLMPQVRIYGPVAYEWSKDGKVIAGATDLNLVLSNVTSAQDGRYSFRVISAECGEAVKEINLKVYKKLSVNYSPELEKCPGEGALLQVNADASVASEFVWTGPDRNGWVAESDGYSASYKNDGVRLQSDGLYQCKITNVCGEKVAEIQLSVEKEIVLPDIARHDTVCPGGSVELRIPIEQSGVKYTWTLPDHRIVEQEVLTLEKFSVADTGVYHYNIQTKNGCFDVSGDITLHIRPDLQLPRVSPDTAVCEGQAVRFSAYVEGKGVEYEWWGPQGVRVNQQYIDINPVTAKSSGIYEVMVTDLCNRIGKRGKVRLSLLKEFEDLTVSRDTGICRGGDVTFEVQGKAAGLRYEWKFGEQIPGKEAILEMKNVDDVNAGEYVCVVSGTCQTVEKKVNLKVYRNLIARAEEYLPVCVREDAELSVVSDGEKVKFRWLKEGDETGYRTNRLVLNDVIPSDAGIYECRVTSLCGDTTLFYNFRLKEDTRILRHSADRILCEGDEYKLMVEAKGENNHYTWTCDGVVLAEQGDLIRRVAPTHADTLVYTCRVQGDCGVDSISVVIQVGEFHKIRTDVKDTLCEESNYKYNVDVIPLGAFEGQGFNYRWTFKGKELYSGTSSIFSLSEVKPEQSGVYLCEITTLPDAFEFKSAEVKMQIEVIDLPRMVSMTPDIYTIEGSSTSIKAVATGDELVYSWKKDGVAVNHASPSWYFTPVDYDDRGRYEVTVSNRCSHVKGKTELEVWRKTVIVFPQERSDSVCFGGSIPLEVVAWGEVGLLYKWYLGGKLVDAPFVQPLNIEDAGFEDAGLYICVVSGRGGSDSCKIQLKVLALPEVAITGKFQLCRDDAEATQIYVGSSSNEERVDYGWRVTSGELLEGISWGNATVRWDKISDGLLTLKITSLTSGCSNSKSEKVTYHPVPEVNLVVPPYVGNCRDTLKLERAYPWGGFFTVNGAPTDVVRFADKGIYYSVEYYYADAETGCSATGQDTIRVAAAPVLRLAQDTVRTGWCAPVQLEVKKHSEGTIVWGGKQLPEVTDLTHAVYKAQSYSDEVLKFWAVLTDQYQCRASDTSAVILLPSPKVGLMPDTVIGACNGLVLRGSYDVVVPQKVEWSPAGKLNVLDGYTAELSEKKEGVHEFELAVTDQYGCVGRDTMRVSIEGTPLLESKELCVGNSIVVDAGHYAEYLWSDGYEESRRVLSEPGIYDLEVKDEYGCQGEASYVIRSLPVISLNDTLIYEGQQMEFGVYENMDYPPYRIVWQDGSGRPSFTAETEGYYMVKVSDNMGCTAVDSAFLTVKKWYIAAPDAFLPSSGGENARFYLKEVNFGSRFEMFIYDRWGELLFQTNEIGYQGGWNGTFKGMHCQPGAYVWVALVDGKEVGRGTLMLVK